MSEPKAISSNPPNRRRDYRVKTLVTLRERPLAGDSGGGGGASAIALFEELSLAAARYRKELGPAGRGFVDAAVQAMDAVAGQLAATADAAAWNEAKEVEADLSATGIGVAWETEYEVETALEIEFSLCELQTAVPIRAQGSVTRCSPLDGGGFDLGIQFADLSSGTHRRLVRALLDLQRVQLRARGGEG